MWLVLRLGASQGWRLPSMPGERAISAGFERYARVCLARAHARQGARTKRWRSSSASAKLSVELAAQRRPAAPTWSRSGFRSMAACHGGVGWHAKFKLATIGNGLQSCAYSADVIGWAIERSWPGPRCQAVPTPEGTAVEWAGVPRNAGFCLTMTYIVLCRASFQGMHGPPGKTSSLDPASRACPGWRSASPSWRPDFLELARRPR